MSVPLIKIAKLFDVSPLAVLGTEESAAPIGHKSEIETSEYMTAELLAERLEAETVEWKWREVKYAAFCRI